jgi:HK97 family phage prohead protease/HK97 family phage major capsid protein
MRTTEAITTVRAAEDNPRAVEGIAVPYGHVATATELGAEAFAPAAFRASVERWMGRQDGARMAFRAAHGERPIGTVTGLADTPEGVMFRAEMFETPEADRYLAEVGAGLNGVSIEFQPGKGSRRGKDGVTLHREANLFAIAGATLPAYDGARVSLRDMEDMTVDETTTTPEVREAQPEATTEASTQERARREDATIPAPSTIRITRTELVYGRESGHSFLQDLKNASHDTAAAERQHRHQAYLTDITGQLERAGELLQSEIPGILPTEFLPGLATPAVAQDTPMSSFYNTFAISDPRPRTFGKVTTSTAVSTTAKVEGAAPTVTDMATTAVTVTPAVYAAQIDVSREVVDAADPIAERLLIQDLTNRFNETVEAKVLAAVEAGSSASGTAITAATPFAGMLGNVNKYYATRYVEAKAQFVPSALYAVALSQLDSAGRPILPYLAPYNANGTVMAGGGGAWINGARVYLSPASTANVVVTADPSDFVIYRSPMLTFRYTEVVGPQYIRIAVFGYLGIGTRLGSLKVTAA